MDTSRVRCFDQYTPTRGLLLFHVVTGADVRFSVPATTKRCRVGIVPFFQRFLLPFRHVILLFVVAVSVVLVMSVVSIMFRFLLFLVSVIVRALGRMFVIVLVVFLPVCFRSVRFVIVVVMIVFLVFFGFTFVLVSLVGVMRIVYLVRMRVILRALIVSVIVRVWVFVVLGEKIGLEIFDFRSQGGDVTAHRHLLRRSERTQNLLDCIGNGVHHVDKDDANIG
jgi:hypothetical protein